MDDILFGPVKSLKLKKKLTSKFKIMNIMIVLIVLE